MYFCIVDMYIYVFLFVRFHIFLPKIFTRMKLVGFLIVVAFCVLSSTSTASKISKRSVNFTPSWGKRSGTGSAASAYMARRYGRGDILIPAASTSEDVIEKCAEKEAYLNMLVDKLKVCFINVFILFMLEELIAVSIVEG